MVLSLEMILFLGGLVKYLVIGFFLICWGRLFVFIGVNIYYGFGFVFFVCFIFVSIISLWI